MPLLDSQTLATFVPKIAGGDVTKVALTQKHSDEFVYFCTRDARSMQEKVSKAW